MYWNDKEFTKTVSQHGCFRNETEFSLDALPEAPMAKNSMLNLRRQTTNKLNDKIMIENHLHDDAIGLWIA